MTSKIPTSKASANEIASRMLSAGRENRKASRCCAECKLVIYDREKLKLRGTLGVKVCDTCWAKKRPKDALSPSKRIASEAPSSKLVVSEAASSKRVVSGTPTSKRVVSGAPTSKRVVSGAPTSKRVVSGAPTSPSRRVVSEAPSSVKKCLVKLFDVSRYPASHPFRKGFLSQRSLKRKFNDYFPAENSLEPPVQNKRLNKYGSSMLTASQNVHKIDKEISSNQSLTYVNSRSGKGSRNAGRDVETVSETRNLPVEVDSATNNESDVSTVKSEVHKKNSTGSKKMAKLTTLQLKAHELSTADKRSSRSNSLNTENASKISSVVSIDNSDTPPEPKITRRSNKNLGVVPDIKNSHALEKKVQLVPEDKTSQRSRKNVKGTEQVKISHTSNEDTEMKTSRRSSRNVQTPLQLSQRESLNTEPVSDAKTSLRSGPKPEMSLDLSQRNNINTDVLPEMKISRRSSRGSKNIESSELSRRSINTDLPPEMKMLRRRSSSNTEMPILKNSRSNKKNDNSTREQRNIDSEMPSETSQRSSIITEIPTGATQRSSLSAETPSRVSQRNSVSTEVPNRVSRRSSLNTETPNRTSRRSSLNTETPNRTSLRHSVNAETPSRTSRRSSLSAEMPIRTSQRNSLRTETSNRNSQRTSLSTEIMNKTSQRTNLSTEIINRASQRTSPVTEMPNRTSRRSSLNTEITGRNSINSEVPPALRLTRRSSTNIDTVPETKPSGKKTVATPESRPSKRSSATGTVSEKRITRTTGMKSEPSLVSPSVRRSNVKSERAVYSEIDKKNKRLSSSTQNSTSLLPRPKIKASKILSKRTLTEIKSLKVVDVVAAIDTVNKRKQAPLEASVKRIKIVANSQKANTMPKQNKPVLKTTGTKSSPVKSAVKNQIDNVKRSRKGQRSIVNSNKSSISPLQSKRSKGIPQATKLGSNASTKFTLQGRSDQSRKRKLSSGNSGHTAKKQKRNVDNLEGKLPTVLEGQYKCITCNKNFQSLVEKRLDELSHMGRYPVLLLHKCDSPQGVLSLIREDDFPSINICSSDNEMPKDVIQEVNITVDGIYNEIDATGSVTVIENEIDAAGSVTVIETVNETARKTDCSSFENNKDTHTLDLQNVSKNMSMEVQHINDIDGEVLEKEIKMSESDADKIIENGAGKVTENDTEKVTENDTEKVTENDGHKLTKGAAEKMTESVAEKITKNDANQITENGDDVTTKNSAESNLEQSDPVVQAESSEQLVDGARKPKSSKEIASLLEEIFGESSEEDLISAAGIRNLRLTAATGDSVAERAREFLIEKQACVVTSSQKTSIVHNSDATTSAPGLSGSVFFSGDTNRDTRCPEDVLQELDCEDVIVDSEQSATVETLDKPKNENSIMVPHSSAEANHHTKDENEKDLECQTHVNTATESDRITKRNTEKDNDSKRTDLISEGEQEQQISAKSSVVEGKAADIVTTILAHNEECNFKSAKELSVIEESTKEKNVTSEDSNLKSDVADEDYDISIQIPLKNSYTDFSKRSSVSKSSIFSDSYDKHESSQNGTQCPDDSTSHDLNIKSISSEQAVDQKTEDVETKVFDNEMRSNVLLIPHSDCDRYIELKEDQDSTDSADIEIYTAENSLKDESFVEIVEDKEEILPRDSDNVNSNNDKTSETQVSNSSEDQMSINEKSTIQNAGFVENSEIIHTDDKVDSMGETMCLSLEETGKDVVVIDATGDEDNEVQLTEICEGNGYEKVCSTSGTTSEDAEISIHSSEATVTSVEEALTESTVVTESQSVTGFDIQMSQINAESKISTDDVSDKVDIVNDSLGIESSVGDEVKATNAACKLKVMNVEYSEKRDDETKSVNFSDKEGATCAIDKIEQLNDLNSDCEVSASDVTKRVKTVASDAAALGPDAPYKAQSADTSFTVSSENNREIDILSVSSTNSHVDNKADIEDNNITATNCDVNVDSTNKVDSVIPPSERSVQATDSKTVTNSAGDGCDAVCSTMPVDANCFVVTNFGEKSEDLCSETNVSSGASTVVNGSSEAITGGEKCEAVEALGVDRKCEASPVTFMHDDIAVEGNCESTVNEDVCWPTVVEGDTKTKVVEETSTKTAVEESSEKGTVEKSSEETAPEVGVEGIVVEGSSNETADQRCNEEITVDRKEKASVEESIETAFVEGSSEITAVDGNSEKTTVEESNEEITVDLNAEKIAIEADSEAIFVDHDKTTGIDKDDTAKIVEEQHKSTSLGQNLKEIAVGESSKARDIEEDSETIASGGRDDTRSCLTPPVNGNCSEGFVETTCEISSEKGHTSITEEVFSDATVNCGNTSMDRSKEAASVEIIPSVTVDEGSCDSTTVDERCVEEVVDDNSSKAAEIDSICEIENTDSSDKVEIVDVNCVVASEEVMLVSLNDSRESEPLDSGDKVTADTSFTTADEHCSNSEISSGVSECCPSLVGAETLTFNVRDSVSDVFEEEESVLEADVTHASLHENTVERDLETHIGKNTFDDSNDTQDAEINDASGSNATLKDNVCLPVVGHSDISGLEPISDDEFDFV